METIKEITTVSDLLKSLNDTGQDRLIFRGESSDFGETSLIPSYGRMIRDLVPDELKSVDGTYSSPYPPLPEVIDAIQYERRYLTDFYAHLSKHRQERIPVDLLDAQHRGLPTRLLDWSENPLVALYFATEPNGKDGFFFTLKVIQNAIWQGLDPLDSFGGLPGNSVLDWNIKIMFPVRIGQRISRQLGCFTVHSAPWLRADHDFKSITSTTSTGSKFLNLTAQAPSIIQHQVTRYKISNEAKANLRREISLLGINKETLWLNTEDTIQKRYHDKLIKAISSLKNPSV